MTTQFPEKMTDIGVVHHVKPFPLNQLGESWRSITIDGKEQRRFWKNSTANHKGYTAEWAIEEDRLFLISFQAYGKDWCELNMQDVFGTSKLFAFWFTGELYSNFGERLYGMFEPIYEFNQVWRFEYGTVKSRYVRNNDTPELRAKAAKFKNFTDSL